jgi:DNA polymerase-3 subunit alpha/error-prone DNA polymerase
MALTDINTVTGIYDFIKECKAVAIKPIVGIEFRYNTTLGAKTRSCRNEPFSNQHNFDKRPLPAQTISLM